MGFPSSFWHGEARLKDPIGVAYSDTRIYELTSASIRTSTNSGFVHTMGGSPPFLFCLRSLYRRNLLVHASGAEHKPMNIQIFGTSKCADTRKAQRFFKERGIRFQFVDLTEKGFAKGELRSVAARVPLEQLLDRASPRFAAKGLAHAWLDAGKIENLLLEDPLLLHTPIVRNGKEATVGYCPEVWKTWQS